MPSTIVLALLPALLALKPGDGASKPEEAALKALADRCGSQIEWIRDVSPTDESGTAFGYTRDGKPYNGPAALDAVELSPAELRAKIATALERAKKEKRLVLWHVYRLQGMQMYRAPVLDDYMDQMLWSDPKIVEMVDRHFVPLRTRLSKEVGKEYGLVAWDVVEPLLVFLTPEGKVVHTIDRIRTFDAKWFADVFQRVLAAHPDLQGHASSKKPATPAPSAQLLESTAKSYHDALVAYFSGDEKGALAKWEALATSQPDSPYAWRAAANLLPAVDKTFVGAARHAFEWPFEVHAATGKELPTDTRWRRTPKDVEDVAARAVKFLLHAQRPDGSWNDCRYAYWESPVITPNAWMAITALAATALTEWRDVDPGPVDAALAKAESYLFSDGLLNAGKNEESYAHAYRILYLERTLAQTEDPGLKKDRLAHVKAEADALVAIQQPNGQWAHEYPNAFVTGVVLGELKSAQEMGVPVSEASIEKGLQGLAGARFDDGAFAYGGTIQRPPQNGSGVPPQKPDAEQDKNASGRMAGCEAALLAFGRSDAKNLAKALNNYRQYYDRFEKISKCDFHTDGELGGFFFFHDLFHTTEALRRLPKSEAKLHKELDQWFVEKLTSLPEIDGSFLDDHELGKSCSTAFALLALKDVTD
jgi:hypothetical protein